MDPAALRTIAEWGFWGYSAAAAGYALLTTLLMVAWRDRNHPARSGLMLVTAASISMVWAIAVAASIANLEGACSRSLATAAGSPSSACC